MKHKLYIYKNVQYNFYHYSDKLMASHEYVLLGTSEFEFDYPEDSAIETEYIRTLIAEKNHRHEQEIKSLESKLLSHSQSNDSVASAASLVVITGTV